MAPKPRTAAGYDKSHVGHVRATCLYVGTKLGDLLDEVVIVGGLVPTLLINQAGAREEHAGTADLDVGLALAIFDDKRYAELAERLRSAGFGPDKNAAGKPTRQRWTIDGPPKVTVDFLIPPTGPADQPGRVKSIEDDFAAIIAPGLRLAFRDRERITLSGSTIRGEKATRDFGVCGPAAFIAMKALAFRARGENKDAYDLTYVLLHHPVGIKAIGGRLAPLLDDQEAKEAVKYLNEDFDSIESLGPRRFAEFLSGERNEQLQSDAWGAIRDLIDSLPK